MDLSDKLYSLLSTLTQETVYYFYYDPSDKIVFMTNHIDQSYELPYVQLLKSQIVDLENPSMDDFYISEVEGKKQVVQKKKTVKIDTIEDIIYLLPRRIADPKIKISQVNYQFDLLIEQDNQKKEFRIRLSGGIKDQFDHKNLLQSISFYVTAENDPNILYKTLVVDIDQLLQHHYYTLPYDDFEEISCNIFSRRYFENYLHMVIE